MFSIATGSGELPELQLFDWLVQKNVNNRLELFSTAVYAFELDFLSLIFEINLCHHPVVLKTKNSENCFKQG